MKWRDRLADWISGGELTRARANAVAWFNSYQNEVNRSKASYTSVANLQYQLDQYRNDPRAVK